MPYEQLSETAKGLDQAFARWHLSALAEAERELDQAKIMWANYEMAQVVDENYADLLDQMDEAWGSAPEIGRIEINAFLESRFVHKPTTRLREENARLRAPLLKFAEAREAELAGLDTTGFSLRKEAWVLLDAVLAPSGGGAALDGSVILTKEQVQQVREVVNGARVWATEGPIVRPDWVARADDILSLLGGGEEK